MNGYELSRNWFDWCFENTGKVKPTHTALYFFAIEHCNRLGWKARFGLPTQMAMDAIGIKNWRTYSRAFEDLVDWGFFKVYERSKNQYSATVIGIVKNTKANTKAYTKAVQKHIQKQVQKQSSSIAVIDKPINLKPNNNINVGDSKKEECSKYKRSLLSEIEISDAFNSQYLEIALSFQKLFRINLEEAGASTSIVDKAKGTWVDDIRLMIEKDGYSLTDLRDVYKFLQKDDFWKQNILSTKKLREKMPQLKLKMHNGKNRGNNKEATSLDQLAEILKHSFEEG